MASPEVPSARFAVQLQQKTGQAGFANPPIPKTVDCRSIFAVTVLSGRYSHTLSGTLVPS
ncbi:MAG: hypothetical protein ACJA16_004386 [Akkermansiaceae bacterium]|jgi:hypothetical protein